LNSTLPLPLTQALADALKALYVRKTLYENAHAIQFRKNIASYILAAKTESLAPIARYTLAYEEIHAIAVGFLYVHGLAPSGKEGHRIQALTLMYTFLDLDVDDRSEIIHACNTRNDKLYRSPAPPVSTAAAKDLVDLAVRAEATARERLPGWFALA
jgi:hypothetical protein